MNCRQPAIVALRATYLPAYKAADIYVPIIYVPISLPLRKQGAPLLLSRVLYKFTTFYAKQTQFPKSQDEPKIIFDKGLRKGTPTSRYRETNPIKPSFKGKKMLLHLTINARRESFGYYADQIEAAAAC